MSSVSQESEKAPSKRQVVIVDDDETALAALTHLVGYWGGDAIPFSSYHAARTFLSEQAPDALVVDIRLGEFNGLQLVIFAKDRHPELVVAVVSGFDDPVLREEAARAGATFWSKPIDLQGLRNYLFRDLS